MQLVIDIGNTSTSLALMRGERVGRVLRIEASVQTTTTICAMLRQAVGANIPVSVGIASVVPLLNPLWEGAVQEVFHCSPIFVDYRSPLGIKITYPHPETIGADRLANAAGAVRRYGAPVIVADFGTAVTFDLVTPRDGYMGGVIAPGLPLMFDYLADRTAKLPRIRWAPVRHRVGKSTV